MDTTRPKGTPTYYRVTATLADGTETAAREGRCLDGVRERLRRHLESGRATTRKPK